MKCKWNKITVIVLSIMLVSCTYNPFSLNNELTGNPVGPLAGGIAGVGILSFFNAPRALVALGGLGGAGLGYYFTTLRYASGGIINSGGQVFTLGEYVSISIPADQLFELNSIEFTPCACPILESVVAVLNRYPNNNILISGNTTGFATAHYERKLSEARARQVAAFLWCHGIMGLSCDHFHIRKLTYVGYGNYFPIANNICNESLRLNSRVQITAYPPYSQLYMNVHCKVFGNIAALDEDCGRL